MSRPELVIGSNKSDDILREVSIQARQPVSYDTKLSDFCIDSLKMQDFLMELEDFYDITLGMHECAEVVTVSDLVELIESKI